MNHSTLKDNELAFYVVSNRSPVKDGEGATQDYNLSLPNAITIYLSYGADQDSAIGVMKDGIETDLVHRLNGESVLVSDYQEMDEWKHNPYVCIAAVSLLLANLNIEMSQTPPLIVPMLLAQMSQTPPLIVPKCLAQMSQTPPLTVSMLLAQMSQTPPLIVPKCLAQMSQTPPLIVPRCLAQMSQPRWQQIVGTLAQMILPCKSLPPTTASTTITWVKAGSAPKQAATSKPSAR